MTKDESGTIRYLMDRAHWRLSGISDMGAFFAALSLLEPGPTLVALAEGAWPPTVLEVLTGLWNEPGTEARGRLAAEFERALFVPVGDTQMAALGSLLETHADIEVAMHVAALTPAGALVEWFDAPDDPISVSASVRPASVATFAERLGGSVEWIASGV